MVSRDYPIQSRMIPELVAQPNQGHQGRGIIASKNIRRGATLVVFGGTLFWRKAFEELDRHYKSLSIQVDDDQFLVSLDETPADWVNHSCDPNSGMSNSNLLVAIRDIKKGERVCYDYCMTDGSAYDEFVCHCEAASCRRKVTGQDWRDPDLLLKYDGFFSPYLVRRIDALGIAPSSSASKGLSPPRTLMRS